MSKFESISKGKRRYLIWNAIHTQIKLLKAVLIYTAVFETLFIIISLTSLAYNKNPIAIPGIPIIVLLLIYPVVMFVGIYLIGLFKHNMSYLEPLYILSKRHTYAVILIAPPKITLRKQNGVESIIYQEDVKKIHFLDNNGRNDLLPRIGYKAPIDINLNILKIETKNGGVSFILDVYDEAKQILNEINDLFPIEGIAEYMQKSADEFAEQN